ncbi:hypothetical protein GCM10010313_08980 [Streptomyces violarus]|uniref:Uncharacterized protein n=1 Tax=Streptomyces violarus TaxID=67380 RepID=A0A7W5EZG4_9ACTN|nr:MULTISPECIES: hypothetical protein [Streptomyces]MBB3074430.1 hypothetical protein [Streptomyces violarus]WRT97122.1 hypothetical protein VJ737_05215 [Streptomyces sp. CGMCC 4.1772]GHC99157.1 hypothetical protein GCM10010313_08980 [Streptomyces violarus]
MGVGDVPDHAMSWFTSGAGRTIDGHGAVEGLAEGGGAGAGRTGPGAVDPPQR